MNIHLFQKIHNKSWFNFSDNLTIIRTGLFTIRYLNAQESKTENVIQLEYKWNEINWIVFLPEKSCASLCGCFLLNLWHWVMKTMSLWCMKDGINILCISFQVFGSIHSVILIISATEGAYIPSKTQNFVTSNEQLKSQGNHKI